MSDRRNRLRTAWFAIWDDPALTGLFAILCFGVFALSLVGLGAAIDRWVL